MAIDAFYARYTCMFVTWTLLLRTRTEWFSRDNNNDTMTMKIERIYSGHIINIIIKCRGNMLRGTRERANNWKYGCELNNQSLEMSKKSWFRQFFFSFFWIIISVNIRIDEDDDDDVEHGSNIQFWGNIIMYHICMVFWSDYHFPYYYFSVVIVI